MLFPQRSCSLPPPQSQSENATEAVEAAWAANSGPEPTAPTAPASTLPTEADISGDVCLFPSYFSVFGVLALIATALPAQLPHLAKVALLIIVALAHCLVNVFVLAPGLDQEEEPNLRDWPK